MLLQIESPYDQMLHLAALQGNLGKLRLVLDSGRVHIDVQDAVGSYGHMLASFVTRLIVIMLFC